jgi:hypothetical protein
MAAAALLSAPPDGSDSRGWRRGWPHLAEAAANLSSKLCLCDVKHVTSNTCDVVDAECVGISQSVSKEQAVSVLRRTASPAPHPCPRVTHLVDEQPCVRACGSIGRQQLGAGQVGEVLIHHQRLVQAVLMCV